MFFTRITCTGVVFESNKVSPLKSRFSVLVRMKDRPSGAHGDVVLVDDKAYVFYFTHPDRKSHGDAPLDSSGVIPYRLRRSSIQVAELVLENGTLVAKRDEPFNFFLPPQDEKTALHKKSSGSK